AVVDVQRRNSLLHEGVLVAANEVNLFWHGIRTERVAKFPGGRHQGLVEARVLGTQANDVLHGKQHAGGDVDVDVGDDLLERDSWHMNEVVRAQQTHLFAGDKDEKHRAARRLL